MKAARLTPYLVAALTAQRLLEVRHARRNEVWARAQGAVEYGAAHYPLFFVLHPAWLLGIWLEGRRSSGDVRWSWLLALLALQPLRYWVIRTLGRQWNTRILIVPGETRVTGGPFKYLRHPNYAVVAAELLSAALSVNAARTAGWASVCNAALLLLIRIPAENRALGTMSADTKLRKHPVKGAIPATGARLGSTGGPIMTEKHGINPEKAHETQAAARAGERPEKGPRRPRRGSHRQHDHL